MSKEFKRFIDQLEIGVDDSKLKYSAGIVYKEEHGFIVGYEQIGAQETFSIGQPVFNKDKELLGYLGIGLFRNLDYSAQERVPCEYWSICLPTDKCIENTKIFTYWQTKGKSEE